MNGDGPVSEQEGEELGGDETVLPPQPDTEGGDALPTVASDDAEDDALADEDEDDLETEDTDVPA